MSNQSEQDIAEEYCLNRKLVRPQTNVFTLLKWVLLIEVSAVAVSYIVYQSFEWFGISFQFKSIYTCISILLPLLLLKRICILLIELYQHYAPENMRRRCVCMPSCSEYGILALRKYGVIKGLYKTYIRLTKKCKGSTYIIDYP
ncbi:membrane protein insertion efficiency factor YidD [Bacteroidales bacterium OttesenSCG-928-C19]|nr:membrane protein insertion efficiency factor YidD [Bacteroidales bacterium OttesenSCG-928-C19]